MDFRRPRDSCMSKVANTEIPRGGSPVHNKCVPSRTVMAGAWARLFQIRQFHRCDEKPNRPSLSGSPLDEAPSLQPEHHIVDRGRRHSEIALHIGLGRRSAIHLLVVVDERQILTLFLAKCLHLTISCSPSRCRCPWQLRAGLPLNRHYRDSQLQARESCRPTLCGIAPASRRLASGERR